MTIQTFSMKTGIPKSTLRFYEEKNLLKSVRQEDSNYRMYSRNQIPLAKMIASLRTAKVPIRDIQLYLEVDERKQKQMKEEWIQAIKENQKQLEVSLRYLESEHEEAEIYMFEKPAEKVIWFEGKASAGEFSQDFKLRREQMKQNHIPIKNTYLRYISGNRKQVKAEIGFGIPNKTDTNHIHEGFSEKVRGCFCIALTFKEDFSKIETAYHKLMQYCIANGWTPAGSILEWYRGDQIDAADIMIPVTYIGGKV